MSESEQGWYERGGYFPQDAPARLRKGEYVLTAEQAARAGSDYIKRMYGEEEDVT